MDSRKLFVMSILVALTFALTATISSADLSTEFYAYSCPEAIPTIKRVIEDAVAKERRMGASLLRLHFHDCFVKGCDGSILLDPTETMESEKSAPANLNSARGFDVIDAIKAEVDHVCGGSIVSCADILTVAARDSVVALGGPWWEVPLGRRDSLAAFKEAAGTDIPSPFMDLPDLTESFKSHGLNEKDLIALSGGHTLGFAQCTFVKPRLYQETNVNRDFAAELSYVCPKEGGDTNLAPFDPTPATFDKKYFESLVDDKGLLHSDQALFFRGGPFNEIIKLYSHDIEKFSSDFAYSMVRLGNLKPLTGNEGEIRKNCRKVNY